MFPLYDESAPLLRPPYVTLFLITINVLIFIIILLSGDLEAFFLRYGTIPEHILRGENLFTLFTSMFLHAGFIHLIGNMWFLWLFGDNLEDNLGRIRFLVFYLIVGIIANIFHVFTVSSGQAGIPVVGASGAISGLLGGYLVLFPKSRIRAFMVVFYRPYLFSIPAFLYIAIWFLYQLIYQLLYIGIYTSIAYMAHIGGFISGMVLIFFFRREIIREDYVSRYSRSSP